MRASADDSDKYSRKRHQYFVTSSEKAMSSLIGTKGNCQRKWWWKW